MVREHESGQQRKPVWMVERQAYGGPYWESVTFGPFATREEAEEFARLPAGGFVYVANRDTHHA